MTHNPFDIYTVEYENWFKDNHSIFQSELLALKQVVPIEKNGIEIGIGSGIFAEQLGVKFGIDPSENMLQYARKRNLTVVNGIAENVPYADSSFDFAIFITSLCFIADPLKALQEAYRITNDDGIVIVAFIDKNSALGQVIDAEKQQSKFYKSAKLYSVQDMISLIEESNFKVKHVFQTLTNPRNKEIENSIEGFGKGSFIVIKSEKKQ